MIPRKFRRIRTRAGALMIAGTTGVVLAACVGVASQSSADDATPQATTHVVSSAVVVDTTTSSTTTTPYAVRQPPIIYRPPGLSMANKVPLLIAFHGAGSGPQNMEGLTHFEELAQQYGFVVVYPDTSDPSAPWKPPSDVTYVSSLINQVIASENIDPSRVYATGFSAGGFEALEVGCNLSRQIAGIAVVSESMGLGLYNACGITRPTSFLLMVGTQDAPYYAGGGVFPSAAQVAAKWRSLDGCGSTPSSTTQVTTVLQQNWTGCVNGSAVALYLVQGAGHVWPPYGPGAPSNYSASQAIWSFFSNIQAAPTTAAGTVAIRSLQVSVQKRHFKRTVIVSFGLAEPVTIVEMLAGHRLVHASFKLAAGVTARSQLPVPRWIKRGRYTLTFAVTDAYGRTLSLTRTFKLPAA
jgi:polyhydroxybutyrate depolymerase